MQQVAYETKLFKNIFADYDTFKEWYLNTPLSDDSKDVPNEKTFTLIAYEYNDSHVSMSEESFKEHFAIDLYNYYKEFEETTKAIKALMDMQEEDYQYDDRIVTNVANIPETISSTDEASVDFLSSQQKQLIQKSKPRIKREELANKRAYTVKSFLKKFKHLFIRVMSPAYTFVVEEPEGV